MDKKKPSVEEILEKIRIAAERMKKAKSEDDDIGYEIALKEYEKLYKEYADILYNKKEPTKVYEKRY